MLCLIGMIITMSATFAAASGTNKSLVVSLDAIGIVILVIGLLM